MKPVQASRWLRSRALYGLLGIFLIALLPFSTHVSPRASPAPQGMLALKTRHFTFYYPDNIPKPAIRDMLAFAEGMELAYQRFVLEWGFRDGSHTWTIRANNLSRLKKSPSLSKSIGAHEFFHSIQVQGYGLKLASDFLIEGMAVWAQVEAFPDCAMECFAYIPNALRFLVQASTFDITAFKGDSLAGYEYEVGGYAGGLFWIFLTDRYGGPGIIQRLLEHQDILFGLRWMEALSSLVGKPFGDIWAEFAVALATRQIPHAEVIYPLAEQKTPHVPAPVFVGEWTGQALTIEHGDWEHPYPKICAERREGACPSSTSRLPLTVRHPYGIHFLRIIPKSAVPLTLQFAGDPETDFRVFLVVQTLSGAYKSFPLARGCILSEPLAYTLLQVVVTRGEKGSGNYQLVLQELQTDEYPPCR